jgi:AcrR family transcriptional regulator
MNRIANEPDAAAESRPYRSELRARQAEDTRGSILDAAGRVMARGIATLSIPDIASEAGVSIPTVYRHFRTKQDLLDAIYPHVEKRAGRGALTAPATIGEVGDGVLRVLEHIDAFDDLDRAVMASPAAEEVRHRSIPRRLAQTRAIADTIEPPLEPAARERIARLLLVLSTSGALRTWRDHLEIPAAQVAEEVQFVVDAAIAAERERQP